MSPRILATADWHIGKGADLLGAQHGPGSRLHDQAHVLERIAEIAEAEEVDAILFAGDATDQPRPRPWEMLIVKQAFARLREIAPVVAVNGNAHDVVHADLPIALQLLDGIALATSPRLIPTAGCLVACLPWASVARIVAQHGGGDRDATNEYAAELLYTVAEDLRRRAGEMPAVLMLHFALSGDADGLSRLVREPVLDVAVLEQIGFDAVVAGHFHRAQLLSMGTIAAGLNGSHVVEAQRPILYTGSPMPLSFGEASYPHGVWILDVEPGGTSARFVPVESRPFVTIDDHGDWDFVDGAIVRYRYTASEEEARQIDNRQIERDLVAAGAARVFVEAHVERAARTRVDVTVDVTDTVDDLGMLRLWLESAGHEGESLGRILDRGQCYIEAVS